MGSATERKSARWLVLLAAAGTLAVGAALALGWEPGIRGEWVWRGNALPVRLWPAVLAGFALVALSAIGCRPRRWGKTSSAARATWLAALIVAVFVLQFSLLSALGGPWIGPGAIVASPNATTYFGVSLEVHRPAQWLASYPQLMRNLPHHAATHPPGFVLLFVFVRRLCASLVAEPTPWLGQIAQLYSDTFGLGLAPADAAGAMVSAYLIALIGALGLVPLYLLVSHLVDHRSAICATYLAGSMPALLLLGASPDLIVMTLAVTALCLGYIGWRRGSHLACAFAGLVVAVGLFFSLAFVLVPAWVLLWLALGLRASQKRRADVRSAARAGILALAGFAVFYLVLYIVWGYRPIAVVRASLLAHREVTTISFARTYWKWVLMNPVECALFVGLPLTAAAVWSARALARGAKQSGLRWFLLSALLVFVALDLSGVVRGEVGRIWLFLLWPAAVAGGTWLAARAEHGPVAALLILLQVLQALLMRGYLTIYSIL